MAGLASTFKFSDAMDILAQSGKNVKTQTPERLFLTFQIYK